MTDLDERDAHLETRAGLVPASFLSIEALRRAIAATVPTRWHAVRLYEALLGVLGERALVDPATDADQPVLYVRAPEDARFVVAQPILSLSKGPGATRVVMSLRDAGRVGSSDAPGAPREPRPGAGRPKIQLRPRGPEMCGGELLLAEGRSELALTFDDEGMHSGARETGGDHHTWARHPSTSPYLLDTLARPPSVPPLSLLLSPELGEPGLSIEALATLLARSEASTRSRLRAHLPVPTPGGVSMVLDVGRRALAAALFSGQIPLEARWAAADGLEGKAIAWGASPDETLARFLDEAFRKKPRPPGVAEGGDEREPLAPPPPPSAPTDQTLPDGRRVISTGTVQISIQGAPPRFPWPRAIPANCPALLVPLPEAPEPPPHLRAAGFSRVARTLGTDGAVGHVFVREDQAGLTGIGEHVVDLVDLGALDHELERTIAAHDAELEHYRKAGDDFTEQHLMLALFDDGRRARVAPKVHHAALGARLGPMVPDGDVAPWRVVRARRVE